MVLHPPTRQQSLVAGAAFMSCILLTAGFSLAAKAGDQPAPAAVSAQLLNIVLVAPPEPVIAPRPPMEVLPADARQEFDLERYRQDIALRRQLAALAEARLYAGVEPALWSEPTRDDEHWSADADQPSPGYPPEAPAFLYGR